LNPYPSDEAPQAIGPYSRAVRTGNLLFCSGQTPLDAATMQIVAGDIKVQTSQAIRNLTSVLAAVGLELSSVVKTTVFLSDMELFKEMNAAYAECFGGHRPARTTVAVKGLPCDALVEIECIAEFAEEKGA
jgi:2-iminobutanoate/2-iminopropanoate deaminase